MAGRTFFPHPAGEVEDADAAPAGEHERGEQASDPFTVDRPDDTARGDLQVAEDTDKRPLRPAGSGCVSPTLQRHRGSVERERCDDGLGGVEPRLP